MSEESKPLYMIRLINKRTKRTFVFNTCLDEEKAKTLEELYMLVFLGTPIIVGRIRNTSFSFKDCLLEMDISKEELIKALTED